MYIQYLNNIEVTQLFQSNANDATGSLVSGDVVNLSGTDVYDPDLHADIFGDTGLQASGFTASGSLDDESYGFVKNLGNTGEDVTTTEAHVVSSGSTDILSGDSKEQLKNLILHEK